MFLPGACRGLGQLQRLFHTPSSEGPFLLPDSFGNLSSLQYLAFLGFCLDGNSGVPLPPSLQRLSITFSCLEDVGQLADLFPDLVVGSSSGDAWTLETLDLMSNN